MDNMVMLNFLYSDIGMTQKEIFISNLISAFKNKGCETGRGFKAELARRYNVTPASAGDWLNPDKGYPKIETLAQIAADTDYTIDALMGGVNNTSDAPDMEHKIPILGITTAGEFRHVRELEQWEVNEYITSSTPQNGFRFALRIDGQSMENPSNSKHVPDGSIVTFNAEKRTPNNGDLVLAKINGSDEITFKKFVQDAGRVWLEPLNPRYPIITDHFRVLATAETLVKKL